MFKIILIIVFMLLGTIDSSAKYKYPQGATTTTERRVNRIIRKYSSENNGSMTLEDYEKYRQPRTVEERRLERQAKRKGTYVAPKDAFLIMDTDGNGSVTKEELLSYERNIQNKKNQSESLTEQNKSPVQTPEQIINDNISESNLSTIEK